VERDKPKKSESVGQTFPQLPWKQKRGIKFFWGFLSPNFIKLCRNIHRSVWQLLEVEIFLKMAAVAMVTKVQKNAKFKPYSGSFLKLDTKIDHHSKLCSLFLKFSKWPPI
jgi:hypothetical protein